MPRGPLPAVRAPGRPRPGGAPRCRRGPVSRRRGEDARAGPPGTGPRHGSAGADERTRTADLRITNALLYQLSYIGSHAKRWNGAPRRTRTPNLLVRSQMLYPIELSAHRMPGASAGCVHRRDIVDRTPRVATGDAAPAARPGARSPKPTPIRRRGQAADGPGAMAERGGFEPPVRFWPHNRLAGGCLQPLGHLSGMFRRSATGGGRGTRTPKGFHPAVFKTAALPVRLALPAKRGRTIHRGVWTGQEKPRGTDRPMH